MSLHQPGPVSSLKLEADSLLLCSDDVSVGGGVQLRLLLHGDGVLDHVNLALSDGLELCLFLVKLLVNFSSPVRANLRTKVLTYRQSVYHLSMITCLTTRVRTVARPRPT